MDPWHAHRKQDNLWKSPEKLITELTHKGKTFRSSNILILFWKQVTIEGDAFFNNEEVLLLMQSSIYKSSQPSCALNNPAHSNADLCFYVTRGQSRSARAFNPTTAQRSEIGGFKAQLATTQSCLLKASVHHQPTASSSFTYRCFWIEDDYLFVHIRFRERLIRTPPVYTGSVASKHEDRRVY